MCPNPEEIISHPGFWSDLADDLETCTDEDNCENEEIQEETQIEEFSRKRLMEIAPTPTGKLDSQNLANFDFTNRKLQPIRFTSREGIQLSMLSMDHRSLRKAVYSHPKELGLSDLGSKITCPVQTDPNKFQRLDC